MKEDNLTIIAIVSLGITLGLFGFLAYLFKKGSEPTIIAQAPAQASAKPVEVPKETGKTFLKEAEIGEVDKPSEYAKTEEARPRFPHIVNYSIHEANRWYEIKLPKKGVKTWSLRCRDEYNINYCFEPTASTYMTLPSGETLSEDTAPNNIPAIYVRCAEAGVTIEFELWREQI